MQIDELIKIANAATPGPWEHVHVYAGEEVIYQSELNLCVASLRSQFDAKHIATFSPEMVLKLLDCAEALEFYADQSNYDYDLNSHGVTVSEIDSDLGAKAMEALAALKETE